MGAAGRLEVIDDRAKPETDYAVMTDDPHRHIAELQHEIARLNEAVSARDDFLAVTAHELKNGMTPVLGRVDILSRRAATLPPEEIVSALDYIVWLTKQFAKRATTLLDVSRMTSGVLQLDRVRVDASKIVRDVAESFRPLADRAGSELVLDLPDGSLVVIGDRLSLEQICDNLISNAIKYGDGQPIAISAHADLECGTVRLSVRDNGPGILPADQARIFERFERAVRPNGNAGGFGVGLWVVKQLTDAMAGEVDVSSAPGAGSTFCITLPIYRSEEFE